MITRASGEMSRNGWTLVEETGIGVDDDEADAFCDSCTSDTSVLLYAMFV
jgi:hypothetical protein